MCLFVSQLHDCVAEAVRCLIEIYFNTLGIITLAPFILSLQNGSGPIKHVLSLATFRQPTPSTNHSETLSLWTISRNCVHSSSMYHLTLLVHLLSPPMPITVVKISLRMPPILYFQTALLILGMHWVLPRVFQIRW